MLLRRHSQEALLALRASSETESSGRNLVAAARKRAGNKSSKLRLNRTPTRRRTTGPSSRRRGRRIRRRARNGGRRRSAAALRCSTLLTKKDGATVAEPAQIRARKQLKGNGPQLVEGGLLDPLSQNWLRCACSFLLSFPMGSPPAPMTFEAGRWASPRL